MSKKTKAIRCDNGPEYISGKINDWAKKHDIDVAYIQPGNPQHNAFVERFNRIVRYDWLNQYYIRMVKGFYDACGSV